MESPQKLNRVRAVIIVLAVLLTISLAALAVMLVRSAGPGNSATAGATNNLITPAAEAAGQESAPAASLPEPSERESAGEVGEPVTVPDTEPGTEPATEPVNQTGAHREKITVALHSGQPEDNTPFQAANMLPGDTETRNYTVRISHSGDVTVRFHADIQAGSGKLAEVLMARVRLPATGEILYDGLMRDMPASLNHPLSAPGSTVSDLNYEITAYLDTGAGKEYQDKTLLADFRWWVEEAGKLDPPKTGDRSPIAVCAVIAVVSLAAIVLLLIWRRKETREHEGEQSEKEFD